MAKLCPRGKAAAKRKFKVYPSAYANMYASAVCSGKVTPGGKKNRKKAMGGGMMNRPKFNKGGGADKQTSGSRIFGIGKTPKIKTERLKHPGEGLYAIPDKRKKAMGGGMMMDRGMYSKGGAVAKGCGAIMSDRKKKTRMV